MLSLLQTYFIKANGNSVSDGYFRVMTKAKEYRIEFQLEIFRVNKNNHGLVEVEGKKSMHQYIIFISLKLKSCPMNHNLLRNHIWKIQMYAYNSNPI